MVNSEKRPARRVVRIKDYDYSHPGLYFVTICIEGRKCAFGNIIDGEMCPNEAGQNAQSLWEDLPRRFPTLQLDHFVFMPNHMHGIIEMTIPPLPEENFNNLRVPARLQTHTQQQTAKKARLTLGQIVRSFKGVTTYTLHKAGWADFAWQRSYYESLIRDEKSLEHIRNYIVNNPLSWAEDSLYT